MFSFLNAHDGPDLLVRLERGGGGRRIALGRSGGGRRTMLGRFEKLGLRLMALGPVIGRPNVGRRALNRGLPARVFRKPLRDPRVFRLK